MRFFRMKAGNTSYTYPILKAIVCVAVIALLLPLLRWIHFENRVFVILERIGAFAVFWLCVFGVYLSVGEIIEVHETRAKKKEPSKRQLKQARFFTVDEIVLAAEENDIIAFQIVWQDKTLELGASADYKNVSGIFFDKRYYIGEDEFKAVEDFKAALLEFEKDGKVQVLSVDGLAVR